MVQSTQAEMHHGLPGAKPADSLFAGRLRIVASLLLTGAALLVGCGAGPVTATTTNATFSISPGSAVIDTSCTGCNALNAHASPVHQFSATLAGGGAAPVSWTISGGDPSSGPGKINDLGQYTPPSFLTGDQVEVQVTATLKSNPALRAIFLPDTDSRFPATAQS